MMTTEAKKPRIEGQPWTISEAIEFLKISRSTIDKMVKQGQIRAISLGRRRYIPDAEIQKLAREGC